MIWACYCYNLDRCVVEKFNFSLFFALFLGFITSTTLSFKLWKINSFKFQHICNPQMFSFSIFYCFMDDVDNRVLFLTKCMLLFQIRHYVFNFFLISSMDPSFYNFNLTSETYIKFLLTIIMFHYFQLYNFLLVLSQDLGHWVKPRSTTWFSRFLLIEFNENKWIKHFRMTKTTLFRIVNQLWPLCMTLDIKK